MSSLPALPDFSGGGSFPTTSAGLLVAAISFLMNPPIAELRQNAVQSIAVSGTWTAINLETEDVDSVNGHDTATNPSRYTAVYPGWYLVSGGVGYASNATGRRGARFAVNGTVAQGSEALLQAPTTAGGMSVPARAKLIFLAVGDYVEIQGMQESGGALNTNTGSGGTNMSISWQSS